MPDETTAAILLAAGASTRMEGEDKLWADLGGEPLVAWPLRTLATLSEVDLVVVVARAGRHTTLRTLAGDAGTRIVCVEGGARRRDSVAAGIAAAPEATWYLVHDAARPLLSGALACRVLEAAREHGAAVPAVRVADTLKRSDSGGRVVKTVDRSSLHAVQTPQAFAGPLLRRAHAEASDDATDDAALVEQLGERVQIVEGDPANMKVTAAADLALVRALAAIQAEAP